MAATPPTIDELLDHLRQRGDRVTVARRAVLEELLDEPDSHLTAEELADRIHRRHPDLHLSTVYRTVEFLEQAGLLTQVHVGHGPSSYHFAADRHHHAVCQRCGAEVELPGDLFGPVVARLHRDYGFEADPHHLAISGTCAACAERPPLLLDELDERAEGALGVHEGHGGAA